MSMAKHYCEFTSHSYYYGDRQFVGEIISTYCQSNDVPYFVIECNGSYYTKRVDECHPADRPKKKKNG